MSISYFIFIPHISFSPEVCLCVLAALLDLIRVTLGDGKVVAEFSRIIAHSLLVARASYNLKNSNTVCVLVHLWCWVSRAAKIGEERVHHATEQLRLKGSGLESETKRIEQECEKKLKM